MKINKVNNEYDAFDFDFTKDGKMLSIDKDDSNLYITCKYLNYKETTNITFTISKDDEIHSVFNKLYTNITGGNIFDDLNDSEKSKTILKNESVYKKIVKDNVITIHCDAYPLEYPNILKIKKENENIILDFKKVNKENLFKCSYTISINIKMKDSRLLDFCIPFNTMYNDLQRIENSKEKTLVRK